MTAGADQLALPDRIYLLSQARRPSDVRQILVNAALTDGWMPLVVNMNMSIFVGLIALTAGYGPIAALVFLALHLTVTTIAMVIYLLLHYRRQRGRDVTTPLTERLLYLNDVLVMLGWGAGLALFFEPADDSRSLMLVILLAVAGIASAALNAKTLTNLLLGRAALFGPAVVFVALTQPALWPLLLASLTVGAAFAVGIGYAVYVQLLNEANLVLQMQDANVLLSQQSLSLERSAQQEKESQEKLLKEARIRESFLHSINHDLAQPLSGLDMCLFTLDRHDLPVAARPPLEAAQRSLGTAKSLIRNVSELAKMQGERPRPARQIVPLEALLHDIADQAAGVARKKRLVIRVQSTRAQVWADPDMLARVLRNLVFNAVEYTDAGRIVLGARRRGEQIGIVVADTGKGISEDIQPRVFEAFFRNDATVGDQPHIGLGLAIVQELTQAMGGRVTLNSQSDHGACFEVLLPNAGRMKQQTNGTIPVLLVEDRPDLRHQMTGILQDAGFDVTAPDSPDAMRALCGADLSGFQRIVLDFSLLPDLTALDIIRTCPPEIRARIQVVSDRHTTDMAALLAKMGVGFQRKPLTQSMIQGWINDQATS